MQYTHFFPHSSLYCILHWMCVHVAQILMKIWLMTSPGHCQQSVQGTTATSGSTQTRNLWVLRRKLVVICDLFIDADWLPGVYHNLLLRLHSDDLCIAVGLQRNHMCMCKLYNLWYLTSAQLTFTHITAVINESGYISTFGGINDGLLINSEHVTASYASFFITLLSHVSNYLKRKKRNLFLYLYWEEPGTSKGS